MGVSETASRAASDAAAEIDNPEWLKLLARVGFGSKGVVYTIMGVLAARGVAGTGPKGALTQIVQQPFGKIMLGIVAVGLVSYAAWRIVQSTMDPENEGDDAKAIGKRIGYFCSGIVYLGLAFSAGKIILGSGGGGGDGAQGWTAKLLSVSFGQWLVGIVAVGILLAGFHQLKQGITADFRKEFALGKMSSTEKTWATRAGRLGHIARAVLYAIIGFFLLRAAWTADSSEAKGLGAALDTLQEQPYGPWLLAAAGVGLVCYGAYCFVMARYRKAVVL